MRILTHIFEMNSTSVGPEPTFTVHLVFASNLKEKYITQISLNLHVYFIYFFPNIRSTFRHRRLIYHWCHCYSTLIDDYILFCLQFTWHWYQPDTPELVQLVYTFITGSYWIRLTHECIWMQLNVYEIT